jgi:mono/diheme cytochrome c family protein
MSDNQILDMRTEKNTGLKIKESFWQKSIKLSLILFAGILIISCDYDRRTTGWDYAGDFINSNAYETYSPNPNFANGRTMQPPVPGTIPRGTMPYQYKKTDEDRALAAQNLVNPLENSAENLSRGKEAYGIYCLQCHSETGDGKGRLFVNKKYTYPPASLLSEKMKIAPEADIYHVITVGWGIMGEHGSMIKQEDRWKIAMYIKTELQKSALTANSK